MTDIHIAIIAGIAIGVWGTCLLAFAAWSLLPRDMPVVATVVEDDLEDDDWGDGEIVNMVDDDEMEALLELVDTPEDQEADYLNELVLLAWQGSHE